MNSEINSKKGSSQYVFVEHINPCDHVTPLCATAMKCVNITFIVIKEKELLEKRTVYLNMNCYRTRQLYIDSSAFSGYSHGY